MVFVYGILHIEMSSGVFAFTSNDLATLIESTGAIGLQCFHWGYMPNEYISVIELRTKFIFLLEEEIRRHGTKKPASVRSSMLCLSLLRASGRRVSDGPLHFSSLTSHRGLSSSFRLSLELLNTSGIPGEILEL